MRDVLLKRIRPLVERLANDLADLALARIELELARLPKVFEAALSSYANDAQPAPDLLAAALGPDLAAMLSGEGAPRHTTIDDDGKRGSGQPAPHVTQQGADTPGHRASEAAGNVADPHCTPIGHRGAGPSSSTFPNAKKAITCSKCGFVGGNARGCGTAHQTRFGDMAQAAFARAMTRSFASHAPEIKIPRPPAYVGRGFPELTPSPRAKADPDAEPMTAIAPERRLKPTPEAIAAAKARSQERIARLADRSASHNIEPARGRSDNENADERWSPQRIGEERELAESRKIDGSLPAPRSTFTVTARSARSFGADLGDVSESFPLLREHFGVPAR